MSGEIESPTIGWSWVRGNGLGELCAAVTKGVGRVEKKRAKAI